MKDGPACIMPRSRRKISAFQVHTKSLTNGDIYNILHPWPLGNLALGKDEVLTEPVLERQMEHKGQCLLKIQPLHLNVTNAKKRAKLRASSLKKEREVDFTSLAEVMAVDLGDKQFAG